MITAHLKVPGKFVGQLGGNPYQGQVYPNYVGETTVIPSKEQQRLDTAGRVVKEDVVVEPIPEAYLIPEGTAEITENGEHDVAPYKTARVNIVPPLQEKRATPTKEEQVFTPDGTYYGLSKFTMKPIPDEYVVPAGEVKVTENGTVDVTEKKTVVVAVPDPPLQVKTVTPTKATQRITPDDGVYGMSLVTVNAIPTEYIVPSGTLDIKALGEFSVAQYASVKVDLPTWEGGSY